MQQLANKLIAQARGVHVAEVEAPERSEGGQARVRYGLWPFLSADAPEAAMGLMVALAAQLQRWPDVSVYPLMVAAGEDIVPSDDLAAGFSQFTVDDWQLDYLSENVALWGTLTRRADGWQLEVSIENDLTDAGVETYRMTAPRLGGLVEQMESLAMQIASAVGAGYPGLLASTYRGAVNASDEALVQFLTHAFYWQRALFLTLWDENVLVDWEARFDNLLTAAAAVDADFGGGFTNALIFQAMQPLTRAFVEAAVDDPWGMALEHLPDSAILVVGAAADLVQQDQENFATAVNRLESMLERTGDSITRIHLAEFYRASGRVTDMVDTLQDGLHGEQPTGELYFYYALMMISMYHSNLVVDAFVLAEAPRRQLSGMAAEALAAFDAGLSLMPERLDMRQQRLLRLIEANSALLWPELTELVDKDLSGELVRGVIEAMALLDDVEPGLAIFQKAIESRPERVDLRVNYAITLLQDELYDEAAAELEIAEDMTDDPAMIAEIERLFLEVSDPEFEVTLGELTALLSAGRSLGSREITFLEDAIAQAPTFATGYLMLAQNFLNADSSDRALEVLLDGQNVLPDNAEITAQLARLLWKADEHDLAFDYLNKGLEHHPDDVTLLVLSGQYLFDEGQDDEARVFLMRAESIAPNDRTLTEVKRYIARQL